MVDLSAHRHLDRAHQPIAGLPGEGRAQWIRAERWIGHPAAETAPAAMGELPACPQRNRMPCLLVHGRTGTGKTAILREFGRGHPKAVDPRLGVARAPVAAVRLPPEPAEVPFCEELLGALGLPLVGEVSRIRARRMARDAPRVAGARVPAIDGIHALPVGGGRQRRVFLNVIRLLADEPETPLVCAGTPGARRAPLADNGLAGRFESVELPRWASTAAFRRPLASCAAIPPLRQPSEPGGEKVRAAALKLSGGMAARVGRLPGRPAAEAIRNGAERIALGGLGTLPAWAPLLSVEHRRRAEAPRR